MSYLDEAQLEIAVCNWMKSDGLEWKYVHGPDKSVVSRCFSTTSPCRFVTLHL